MKLYRSIDQNELLENDNTAYVVFTKLLTRVDRRTGAYRTGRIKLAHICNLRPSTLRDALNRLQAATMLRQESDSKATTIYICNWWKYQQDDDSRPSTDRQATDTKQEREKEREYIIKDREKNLLASINKLLDRDFRVLPRGSKDMLKRFTDEEIGKALSNMLKDPWHKSRIKQLKSDYLLRASTIDNFLNYKTVNEQAAAPVSRRAKDTNSPQLSRSEMLRREYG